MHFFLVFLCSLVVIFSSAFSSSRCGFPSGLPTKCPKYAHCLFACTSSRVSSFTISYISLFVQIRSPSSRTIDSISNRRGLCHESSPNSSVFSLLYHRMDTTTLRNVVYKSCLGPASSFRTVYCTQRGSC